MVNNMKDNYIECKICKHTFIDGETAVIFEEPQKKGIKGEKILICDPSEQSSWQKDSRELCITRFIENIAFKRFNFRRIYLASD